jgi:hypothetical protein
MDICGGRRRDREKYRWRDNGKLGGRIDRGMCGGEGGAD